jgi:glycosyltransferase involved in cell wall biosynthesis
MPKVIVNQSYWSQRVTGQQRYSIEISQRLTADHGFSTRRPDGFWAASTLRAWAWVQLVLPLTARGSALLSMTARAPLWCRRHVLVVHDLFVLTNPEWFSPMYVRTHAPLLRAQIKSAAAVVAVSQPVADEIAELRADPVTVATNAPSAVFRIDDDPSAVLSASGVDPGTYFLAVGSRDPRKNLRRLAEAYSLLSEDERRAHPLVLVGGGAKIYRDEDISWPDGTVDVGYVDDDELSRLYRDAATVIFVSLAEGFGLPLVEAAASGATSLVVSDIAVFHWVCGGQVRYVDPTSPVDIASGLRAELQDPSRHDIDLDRFSWDASADAIASVCHRVAEGR